MKKKINPHVAFSFSMAAVFCLLLAAVLNLRIANDTTAYRLGETAYSWGEGQRHLVTRTADGWNHDACPVCRNK